MNKYFHLIFVLFLILFFGCSRKNKTPAPDKVITEEIVTESSKNDSIIVKLIQENDKPTDFIETITKTNEFADSIGTNTKISILNSISKKDADHFYELEKSLEDILLKISYLEAHILIDESTIPTTSYTEKLKKIIDGPRTKHQISLKNESIIEGFIEKDTKTNIMIMTSVGRLIIEKDEIAFIEEITALEPNIIFIGHGLEQKFDTHYLFTGKVLNQGTLRGDFVRVIFKLWADDTNILYSDSAFVEGNQMKYESRIVTDTALKSNKSARYSVKVHIDVNAPVSYITREIHWLTYD